MKKIIAVLLVSIALATSVSAQQVTFFSPEFEEGVKMHLGLNEDDHVTQQQTDTITTINLSGYGITDIRDVVYLANVLSLDLSYNDIRDVAPLLSLDSLHHVDLSANQIEDIQMLVFASSDSMMVNVAYNYIEDFSSFFLPSTCNVRVAGMASQNDKSELNPLQGDVNGNGVIDIGDAVCIVNNLVNKPNSIFKRKRADLNRNGQIDIGDAVMIVNILVGKDNDTAAPVMDIEETTNERDPD